MMSRIALSLCLVCLTGFINKASAQVTIYNTQASFLAAINPGFYTETFQSLSISGTTPSPLNFSSGPFSYTAGLPTGQLFFGAGTTGDHWLSTNTATDAVTFTFAGGITAVGGFFFSSNSAGLAATGSVNVGTNLSSTQLLTNTTPTTFIGFTSPTPFTTLTLAAVQPPTGFLWPTANDFTVGTIAAVPEPATVALMGFLTASGCGFVWYRRRNQLALQENKLKR